MLQYINVITKFFIMGNYFNELRRKTESTEQKSTAHMATFEIQKAFDILYHSILLDKRLTKYCKGRQMYIP